MLKKMLSILLVTLMLLSGSVTFVYADVNASVDEARDYMLSLIESMSDVNEDFYTEESYWSFIAVKEYAESVLYYDGVTEEQLYIAADDLESAYLALEGLVFGDVNGDKKINVKDVTEIQKYLADIIKLSEGRLLCADVNRDGNNNVKDATYIQKYATGIIELRENRFLHQELYIIDLKLQLRELMKLSEEVTVGNKFESESYYRYIDAWNNASSVYGYEWCKPEDITDARENLRLAIEALIPADELPKVPDNGTVKFNAEYEYRIYNYSFEGENTNFLIDNFQDLKTIVSEAGKDYDYNKEIVIPPRYNNEEFFEDNSIIVSLFVVGGTGCEQEFDALTVEGTNLTIHRTVTRPRFYPPDIDYRFTLIEVSKSDIEGVTQIINDTDYVTIAEIDY